MLKISKPQSSPPSGPPTAPTTTNTPTPTAPTYTPNLLPCEIHHDATPINASSRYWSPRKTPDGTHESYFRGRKLKGREVKVPAGFKGVVVRDNGVFAPKSQGGVGEEGEGDGEEEEEVKVLEELGGFGEIVVWGHESVAEAEEDGFVRGVEEWVGFSAAMHRFDGDNGGGK